MSSLQTLKARAAAFAESRTGARLLRALRWAFIGGVVVWLAYQLSGIGWAEVWASRPRTPWFYLIWLVLYLQLPAIEALIYRSVWGMPVREGLWPILRKRVLNQDVVSYSGEAYLFVWARQHLGLPARRVAGALKDNAIASSLGSWAAAVLVVSAFLAAGQIVLADLAMGQDPLYVIAAVAVLAVAAALGIVFRRTIFTLPARTVLRLFGVHFGRFLFILYTLQIVQWWVVVPEAPLSAWATMLAVMTVVNRLPLLPSKDLLGIAAILGMAEVLAVPEAVVAALLITRSALDKATNLLLFVAATAWERWRGPPTLQEGTPAATRAPARSKTPPVAEAVPSE